jgi:alpha-tubulin suppressor-like RCC1 family protein
MFTLVPAHPLLTLSIHLPVDGKAYIFGRATPSAMTDPSHVTSERTPDLISAPIVTSRPDACWVFAIAGRTTTILLDDEGGAWAMGNNKEGQLGLNPNSTGGADLKKWTQISGPWGEKKIVTGSSGLAFSLLVDEDGKVYACGSMEFVRLLFASLFLLLCFLLRLVFLRIC